MTGKFSILVSTKHVRYALEIKRKYTFIIGDSGTGKTKLHVLLRKSSRAKQIKVESNVKIQLITDIESFYRHLENAEKTIYILDEDVCFDIIRKDNGIEFAEKTKYAEGYFVLMTRLSFMSIPYSVYEIYTLERNIVDGLCYEYTMKPAYEKQRWHYPDTGRMITEDKKVGYLFFRDTLEKVNVRSADGNGNICREIIDAESEGISELFVFADGAAFGCFANKCFELCRKKYAGSGIHLYFPESFEYLVLKSGIFHADLSHEMNRTYDYAETTVYFSWERYFTALLQKVSEKYGGYNKAGQQLPRYLSRTSNQNKVYDAMEEDSHVKPLDRI